MGFDEDLRSYLEGLERGSLAAVKTASRSIDENDLRAHLLDCLRRKTGPAIVVEHLHRLWTPRLEALARYVEKLPVQVAPTTNSGALAYASQLIDAALGLLDPSTALVDRLELARVLAEFDLGGAQLGSYALEVHLATRDTADARLRLTRLGRTFLRLRGKDAVKWLLILETLQNQGDWDRWRLSRRLLERGLSAEGIGTFLDMEGDEVFAFSDEMIRHGGQLGALVGYTNDPDEAPRQYVVSPSMRDVVADALEPGPWHSTIAAMLEDERAAVVSGPPSTASEAVLEQSRMITHELRNALMPVRHHIDWAASRVTPDVRERLDKIRHGVERLLGFAHQMVKTTELTTEPITITDFMVLAEEAVSLTDEGDQIEIQSTSPTLAVRARRSRLAIALGNLLRNAQQSARPAPQVRLSVHRGLGTVRIDVDDSGPGVPVEDRQRVFDDGYTTRAGGTGFGLAFVKRVAERDLNGAVWCEDSDLGGARFSIELPQVPTEITK